MNKQLRSLGIMAIALVVGIIVLFAQKSYKSSQTESETKSKLLLPLEKEMVTEILLKNHKAEEIHLVKKGADWYITKPVQDLAYDTVVETLLNSATSTQLERVVDEDPKDLSAYKLDTPELSIGVRAGSEGEFQTVTVGKNTPVGFSLYAKSTEHKGILKASRTFRNALKKEVRQIRNRKLFPNFDRFAVSEMEIVHRGKTVSLKRIGRDDWLLPQENLPAEKSAATRALNAVLDLTGNSVASEDGKDAAKYGLNKPRTRVFLIDKDGKRTILRVSKKGKTTYAKREDRNKIYAIKESFLEKVEQPIAKFRNMNLVSFNRFKVERILLDRGKGSLEIKKDKEIWSISGDDKAQVDPLKVENLLTTLQDLKIMRYNTNAKTQVIPHLTVKLFLRDPGDSPGEHELQFQKPTKKSVLGRRKGLALPFYLSLEDFNKIDLKKQAFLKDAKKKEPKTKG